MSVKNSCVSECEALSEGSLRQRMTLGGTLRSGLALYCLSTSANRTLRIDPSTQLCYCLAPVSGSVGSGRLSRLADRTV